MSTAERDLAETLTELFHTLAQYSLDDVVEQGDGILDLVGDTSVVGGLVRGTWNAIAQYRSRQFILGLVTEAQATSLSPEQMIRRVKHPRIAEMIATTIDAAMFVQSLQAVSVLGMIASRMLQDDHKIGHRDRVAIAALKIMFDEDIDNFVRLYEYARDHQEEHKESPRQFDVESMVKKMDTDTSEFDFELTFEKLKSIQAVSTGILESGFGGPVSSPWGNVSLTELSDYLYDLIATARDRQLIKLPSSSQSLPPPAQYE